MKIVIVGAGFTGVQLAKLLISEKNQVAIIDNNDDTVRHASNLLDCTVLCDDGNSLETLESVGIAKADALVCVTDSDEVNMITCSLVDAVYPNVLKIARVRNYAYYVNSAAAEKKQSDSFEGKRRPLYGINYMINPDVEAADAIVKAVENGAIGNVLTFANSDLELARIMVFPGSPFDGISLKEIRFKTELKFLVAYVEKDGVTSLPSGDSIITAGNTLGILISKKDIQDMKYLCGSIQKDLKKVVLIGAGRIGSLIAEKINHPAKNAGFSKIFSAFASKHSQELVIVDSNDELTSEAAARFPDARVMCADATDEVFLREEGITSFDLAICATHNHEMNMVLAAYLESLGVGQSISLVANGAFATIAEKLGVDVAVPLRDTVVDSIMSHLRGKAVKEVHTITTGELEIVECEITSSSKSAGKLVKEISVPGNFLVLLIKRAGTDEYTLVDGNSQFYTGDHVVLITKSENSKKVGAFFSGIE
ncbi:MAG: NAD-binding protein [Treponema sp.]|nr:NAD-binding protein [Treponema sp.]